MKIGTDVRNFSHNITSPSSKPAGRQPGQGAKAATQKSAMTRSIGDAMSIAQISQNLIQRALSISSRLNSIALDAISTGKINTQEINETLADIKNTLGGFGETIANPVQASSGQPVNTAAFPDITGEIAALREIAGDLKNGITGSAEKIRPLNTSLDEKFIALRTTENNITGVLNENVSGYSAGAVNPRELISRIKADMENDPGHALSAQGNIRNLAAGRLIA